MRFQMLAVGSDGAAVLADRLDCCCRGRNRGTCCRRAVRRGVAVAADRVETYRSWWESATGCGCLLAARSTAVRASAIADAEAMVCGPRST